jgi:indolepyruvate ferredoxin oxidoreductase
MLAYHSQTGLVPLAVAALKHASALNRVALESNRNAFLWGRRAACDPHGTERIAAAAEPVLPSRVLSRNLDEVVARRMNFLRAYQHRAYARRYADMVDRVRHAESARVPGSTALADAVARNYFRLLAAKDEYEVARLHTDPQFLEALAAAFEGDYRLRYHLAVPPLSRPDPVTGEPRKRGYGAWMTPVFRVLARLRFLRGTRLDPFGYSAERRRERALLARYEATVAALLAGLEPANLDGAVAIARLPERIRGYGPVRLRAIEAAQQREAELMAAWRACHA